MKIEPTALAGALPAAADLVVARIVDALAMLPEGLTAPHLAPLGTAGALLYWRAGDGSGREPSVNLRFDPDGSIEYLLDDTDDIAVAAIPLSVPISARIGPISEILERHFSVSAGDLKP